MLHVPNTWNRYEYGDRVMFESQLEVSVLLGDLNEAIVGYHKAKHERQAWLTIKAG